MTELLSTTFQYSDSIKLDRTTQERWITEPYFKDYSLIAYNDEELFFDQRIEFVTEALMLLGDNIYTVETKMTFSEEDAKQIDIFLRKGLAYNLKERYNAIEASNDSWINN